jgi:hypothetical protein
MQLYSGKNVEYLQNIIDSVFNIANDHGLYAK